MSHSNDLQVFENTALLTTLRAAEKDGIIWFVAKDVSMALGYSETSRMLEHCKQSTVEVELNKINNLPPATKWIPESDLYRCIMRSNKAEAEPFQDWVTGQVLPSIRKTGGYSKPSLPSFKEAVEGVEALANYLRLPESGRLALIKPVVDQYGINVALPNYAIDSSSTSTNDSSMPTNSATELLKKHGIKISSIAFNKILESNGFIETLTRKSSKGDKHYKSVTQKGLAYGKNVISPSNNKETQPHWYIESFGELLKVNFHELAA